MVSIAEKRQQEFLCALCVSVPSAQIRDRFLAADLSGEVPQLTTRLSISRVFPTRAATASTVGPFTFSTFFSVTGSTAET